MDERKDLKGEFAEDFDAAAEQKATAADELKKRGRPDKKDDRGNHR